ncbi:unnamed protein product [Anisakis simplex]|uniref:Cystinosin homolog (inferred by orthology to a C. elegans protein) n=1 Tax=Anisakis simplex TaxID=6269 RepID=A0A0M3KIW5_ANISI|nr:unnamed protein product [Anisakis simplex]
MDICQMILQAINTDDWSAFYGNPVKFGLGLVSMIFDIVFIIQHYVLYRNKNASLEAPKIDESRATIDANDQSSMEAAPSEDGSSVPIYVDRTNNPIV